VSLSIQRSIIRTATPTASSSPINPSDLIKSDMTWTCGGHVFAASTECLLTSKWTRMKITTLRHSGKNCFFVLLAFGDFGHWRWQAPFILPPFQKIAFAQIVIYVLQVVRSCMSLNMSNAARQEHDDEDWGFMIY
jgi:hypothetical protein